MLVEIFDETCGLESELLETIERAAEEAALFFGLGDSFSVDILITDEQGIREINKAKRRIDAVTDVLSFPMTATDFENIEYTGEKVFLGDIVICSECIFSQALDYGHSPEREAGFLTVHSMLHLGGFDHDSPETESRMITLQEAILNKMGLVR